ncbi:MAG: SDR family NAD(P)-dependent oxidoreductase [Flavitalea sp.]
MRNILVTGATGNMGKAVIEKFLGEGDRVAGFARKKITESFVSNSSFREVLADLHDSNAGADAVNKISDDWNKIDVAILTAGGYAGGKITDTTGEELTKQFQMNFLTAYNIAQPVFNQMKKQGYGRIFLFGANAGIDINQGKSAVAYGMAKSLIFRLAELLNAEAGDADIHTTVIVPTTIDTPDNRAAMPNADFTKWNSIEEIVSIILKNSKPGSADNYESIIKLR